jgi:hypothetical protein
MNNREQEQEHDHEHEDAEAVGTLPDSITQAAISEKRSFCIAILALVV